MKCADLIQVNNQPLDLSATAAAFIPTRSVMPYLHGE
jgi:hypothetical protein